MNIGIVCYPTFGGSGVLATELGMSLAQKGHNVHFITYNRPVRLGHFIQNITYHQVRVQEYPLFEYPPYESALTSMMVDVARYHNLDLFHVHYAIPHASAGFMARQILKGFNLEIPVITTLHGTDITLVGKNKSFEPVVEFSINKSDGVTAVSDFLKKATYDTFDIQREIKVIPNFVDLKRFHRQDKNHFHKMVAANDERLILHTSNFRKVKRIQDVIKTFQRIVEKVPAKLLMVGDGPERNHAESLCRELDLCDNIIFLGQQNPVEEIYSIGDLFLMPSESESFGLSALEAMACGIPVISSNAGGLPEVNEHGKTGYVCEVGDVDDMGNKALEILKDRETWQRFSGNALEVAQKYAIDQVVPLYESYYEEILEEVKTGKSAPVK